MADSRAYVRELDAAVRAALAGGAVIKAHYERQAVEVQLKSDRSPVTAADRDANRAIIDVLADAFPADAILSEESPDDSSRREQRRVWIIDPLDGTRDFVARTGEFAVHVGLVVDGVAVVGAVYVPIEGALYSAYAGGGATRTQDGTTRPLRVSSAAARDGLRVGISRLNPSPRVIQLVSAARFGQTVAMGASTKLMALACGELDAVINLGSEHEWDTCAPEVIIREAGGEVTDGSGTRFRYNQPDTMHHLGSLATNGSCHDELLRLIAEAR